jgi:GNAT superfamily N-acetyltransferase
MTALLRPVESDAGYEAWRQVRMAVHPGERCDSAEELRRGATPDRLLLLACRDDRLAGSGLARPSDTAGVGFVAPRVLPGFRRDGVGAVLLRARASHLCELGLPAVRASVADPGSLAFAARFGFAETDRQIEQVRSVGAEPVAGRPPAGVQVVLLSDRPGLWSECYERFGCQVLADFATRAALRVSREDWQAHWASDPMFLAVSDGEVIGCAGLDRDPDQPARAEHGLTAVRRDWRRRGVAAFLKRHALHWAAGHGLAEVSTWTQRDNHAMRRLNETPGYTYGQQSITVTRPLPI